VRFESQDASGFHRSLFLWNFPRQWSDKELTAIQRGSLFAGMTEYTLYASLGLDMTEKPWVAGGKQLRYRTLVVDEDSKDRVVRWYFSHSQSGQASNSRKQ
jgi:hypothetical protein